MENCKNAENYGGGDCSPDEYLFRDYRLVRAAVMGADGTEQKQTEQILREQLRELTEDPDHTYIVCREPLSFYYGREFREYRQQNWVEHLLRYGEDAVGHPLWPDVIVLGKNPFLPYMLLRYVAALRSVNGTSRTENIGRRKTN